MSRLRPLLVLTSLASIAAPCQGVDPDVEAYCNRFYGETAAPGCQNVSDGSYLEACIDDMQGCSADEAALALDALECGYAAGLVFCDTSWTGDVPDEDACSAYYQAFLDAASATCLNNNGMWQ